jgi:hypothetical protein
MLERPGAADLLATARDALLAEILPALPAEKQGVARMVAAAIAIALREAGASPPATPDLAALAAEIRAGLHDPGEAAYDATHALLWALTEARAAVSDPRALRRKG